MTEPMHPYEFLQRYGPVALVTGASSGIGEAFAALLAKGGFDLVVVARRRERLQTLAERWRDHEGVNVTVVEADLADPTSTATIEHACEGLDIGLLVCNAGVGMKGLLENTDPQRLQTMVQVNCVAPALLSRRSSSSPFSLPVSSSTTGTAMWSD